MSKPHKVIKTKGDSKLTPYELTAQDMCDILGEIALEKRIRLSAYVLFALQWARIFIEEEIKKEKI